MNEIKAKKKMIDIYVIAILMIVFGIGEIITVIKYNPSFLTTKNLNISALLALTLGCIYLIGGLFILPQRKWASKITISLITQNIILRIVMLITDQYPTGRLIEIIGYVMGIVIAIFFLSYLIVRFKRFQ